MNNFKMKTFKEFVQGYDKPPIVKGPEEYDTNTKRKQKESDEDKQKDADNKAEKSRILKYQQKVTFVNVY